MDNERNKNMKTGKAFLGILAGLATGAVLGMIFAPHKGLDSRRKIAKKSEELADALNKRIDERFDELAGRVAGKVTMKRESDAVFARKTESN